MSFDPIARQGSYGGAVSQNQALTLSICCHYNVVADNVVLLYCFWKLQRHQFFIIVLQIFSGVHLWRYE